MKCLPVCGAWILRLGWLAALGCVAGCQDSYQSSAGGRGTFSEVYSRFDPVAEFARIGCTVHEDPRCGAISVSELNGWKSMQGSLDLPESVAGCDDIATAIRSSLDQVTRAECIDDFRRYRERQHGQLLHGVLLYTADGMRGHVYFWLFPDAAETRINYAILLQEARRGDRQVAATQIAQLD